MPYDSYGSRMLILRLPIARLWQRLGSDVIQHSTLRRHVSHIISSSYIARQSVISSGYATGRLATNLSCLVASAGQDGVGSVLLSIYQCPGQRESSDSSSVMSRLSRAA